MALIKCPECQKEISDKSEACPHCGYPLIDKIKNTDSQKVESIGEKKVDDSKKKKLILGAVISVLVIIVVGIIVFSMINTNTSRIDWSGDEIYCFGSEFLFKEYVQALETNNVITFSYVTDDPNTINVDNHTKIKVLAKGNTGFDAAKIEILEGFYEGRTCWTYQMATE